MRQARIAIVGAGPAGLAAAVAGRRLGFDVTVFEQAPHLAPTNAAMALQRNGQRVLEALGILHPFRSRMRPCRAAVVELPDGSRIFESRFPSDSPSRQGPAMVLRRDLLEHLLASAGRGGADMRFGQRCARVLIERGGAVVELADKTQEEFDIVIACDGAHSAVRENVGLCARKRSVGKAYLRGVAALRMEEPVIREVWGRDGRIFSISPLVGDQACFYCSVPIDAWRDMSEAGLRSWLDGWVAHGPAVASVLRAVPDWRQVAYDELYEVRAERWHRGPVFLAGDAAHAMTPYLGQGANSSLVDAAVLLRLLAQSRGNGGDLASVGRTYEALRLPFVTRVQTASRQAGRLATATFTPFVRARDTLLALGMRSAWLGDRLSLLAAGYNPREEAYLTGWSPRAA